jgi:hypothetical protein
LQGKTAIYNTTYATGADVFVPAVATLQTDQLTETNGLPTFLATVVGIDASPYFYIDFNADHTVVWDVNCTTNNIGTYPQGPCSSEPTLMEMGFNGTNLPDVTGTFSLARFGGFVVSGTTYSTKLCFGTYNCKFIKVYSVAQVDADNWLFDTNGAYGLIGMGPRSYIWEGFVNPDTKLAHYAIELARVDFFNPGQSEITFGSTGDVYYQNASLANLTTSANILNYSYPVGNFSYGIVYTDADGADSSEFFYELDHGYPVTFATNFKGLGLPAPLYSEFVSLFEYVTLGAVVCNNTLDGFCQLPGKCSDYSAYTDYAFKVNFTTNNDGNFMRIPMGAFADEVLISGGNSLCNLYIQYLDTNAAQSTNVILGGMFFQEFFGIFENDYNDIQDPNQSVSLFVGKNAKLNAYIGNETLPEGVNPFIPPAPPAPEPESSGVSVVWIVVLSVLSAVLLGFLGWALYKWKIAQHKVNDVRAQNNAETQRLVNASDQLHTSGGSQQ